MAFDQTIRLVFPLIPVTGTYVVTKSNQSTGPIPYNASAVVLRAAIAVLEGASNVTVSGDFTSGFTIVFPNVLQSVSFSVSGSMSADLAYYAQLQSDTTFFNWSNSHAGNYIIFNIGRAVSAAANSGDMVGALYLFRYTGVVQNPISIPANSVIQGIEFTIAAANSSGTFISQRQFDDTVIIRYQGADYGGNRGRNQLLANHYLYNPAAEIKYGSPADTWDAVLTPEIVNDPSFGFRFYYNNTEAGHAVYAAPMELKIYYRSSFTPVVTSDYPLGGIGSTSGFPTLPDGIFVDLFQGVDKKEISARPPAKGIRWIKHTDQVIPDVTAGWMGGSTVSSPSSITAAGGIATTEGNDTFGYSPLYTADFEEARGGLFGIGGYDFSFNLLTEVAPTTGAYEIATELCLHVIDIDGVAAPRVVLAFHVLQPQGVIRVYSYYRTGIGGSIGGVAQKYLPVKINGVDYYRDIPFTQQAVLVSVSTRGHEPPRGDAWYNMVVSVNDVTLNISHPYYRSFGSELPGIRTRRVTGTSLTVTPRVSIGGFVIHDPVTNAAGTAPTLAGSGFNYLVNTARTSDDFARSGIYAPFSNHSWQGPHWGDVIGSAASYNGELAVPDNQYTSAERLPAYQFATIPASRLNLSLFSGPNSKNLKVHVGITYVDPTNGYAGVASRVSQAVGADFRSLEYPLLEVNNYGYAAIIDGSGTVRLIQYRGSSATLLGSATVGLPIGRLSLLTSDAGTAGNTTSTARLAVYWNDVEIISKTFPFVNPLLGVSDTNGLPAGGAGLIGTQARFDNFSINYYDRNFIDGGLPTATGSGLLTKKNVYKPTIDASLPLIRASIQVLNPFRARIDEVSLPSITGLALASYTPTKIRLRRILLRLPIATALATATSTPPVYTVNAAAGLLSLGATRTSSLSPAICVVHVTDQTVSRVDASSLSSFLVDLSARRGLLEGGGGLPVQYVELLGGEVVPATAFEPDPHTFRSQHYYNVLSNQLFKRISKRDPKSGLVVAHWKSISQ